MARNARALSKPIWPLAYGAMRWTVSLSPNPAKRSSTVARRSSRHCPACATGQHAQTCGPLDSAGVQTLARTERAPELFICLGAQKAGTTWLADVFNAHTDLHFSPRKEVHYFDVRHGLTRKAPPSRTLTVGLKAAHTVLGALFDRLRVAYLRHDMYTSTALDHRAYLAYMSYGADQPRYLCDFTPAYAMLDQDGIADILSVSPRARFLFVLRDPVDRLWSSMRMSATRRAGAVRRYPNPLGRMPYYRRAVRMLQGARTVVRGHSQVQSHIASNAHAMAEAFANKRSTEVNGRSDYVQTLNTLAHLPPEQVCVTFFETLFDADSLARICAFLDIAPNVRPPAKRQNEGVVLNLPQEAETGFLRRLAPQYVHCAALFSEAALPPRWQSRIDRLKEMGLFDPELETLRHAN